MSSSPTWRFCRSDGKQLTFGNEIFYILSVGGIDTLKPEVFSKKRAVGDGDIITGYRIPARELVVNAELIDYRLNATMRSIMNSFFSHKYTYDIYITCLGEERYAKDCRLLQYKCPIKNVYAPIKPTVSMLYPDAYFLSVDEFGNNIAGVGGGMVFPYINPVGATFSFGTYLFSREVDIYNDGDVDAYCKAVFTFRGDVTNPSISKDGSFVKCLDTFHAGDTLVMNAYDKSIKKNGENISIKLDKGSRWNDLVFTVGENTISYDAESGNNLMDVTIYFNKRYLGV